MSKTRKIKKLYWPPKYYRGLSRKKAAERKKEFEKRSKLSWKDPKAYKPFKTDKITKDFKPKQSSYTEQWNKLFPKAKSIKERAEVTGVPEEFLQESYNRGMAAWRTGHRKTMSQQAWSYPRVSSFLLCGKTHYTTDSDLVRKAKQKSRKARKWFTRCKPKADIESA